jgi:multiple sugar transport system permease protein
MLIKRNRPRFDEKTAEQITALAMFAPAGLLLAFFLILPFVNAFRLSLTDQPLVPRLITTTNENGDTVRVQEAAENVGLDNYRDLLSLRVFRLEAERDDQGQVIRDEAGNIEYESARAYLRPAGMQSLAEFNLLGSRYVLGATDAPFYRSLANIFTFVILVVPLQTSFALGLAMLVNQKLPGKNAFRTIYFSPVVTTMAVVSVLWFFLYNPSSGLINSFISVFGLGPYDWLDHPASAMISILLLSIWQGVGFQMVIYLAGFQEIPEELYEAAGLDGANTFQRFRFITLPSLRNTTLFVAISTTILAFKLFVQVDVMTFGTGGPSLSTITPILHMVNQGFREAQAVGYASAIAVVFVLLVLAISLVQRRVLSSER